MGRFKAQHHRLLACLATGIGASLVASFDGVISPVNRPCQGGKPSKFR